MNRRPTLNVLLVVVAIAACGSGMIAGCGGSALNGTGPLEDAGADAAPGTTEDSATPPANDATVDSGAETDSTLPPADSGKTNTDSGADSATDSGMKTVDSGEDSGMQTTDSGTDSGMTSVDSGAPDSGTPPVDSGTPDSGSKGVDSGTADSGSAGVDSGTAADSGAAFDAGTDGEVTIPDGGLAPTPGEVSCGADASCAVPADQCCLSPTGGGSCVASSSACPGKTATVKCNEAADCPGGDVCCVTVNLVAQSATASCQVGPCATAQACRTDQECENGDPCTVQDCGGVTLEMCGLPVFDGVYQCTAE